MKRFLLHIIFILMGSNLLFAQDPQFSQPYANPIYLNPAFTGETFLNRASMTYRNQWSAIENGFSSYIATFDHNEKKIHSGFGGYLLYDQSGLNGYRITGLNLSYAYDAMFTRWSGLKLGASAGYSLLNYNSDDLLFADQIIRDGAATSVENNIRDHTSYLDLGAGVLYYNTFLWAGFSASHLNQPNISLTGQVERLPIKYSFLGGAVLYKKKGQWGKELSSLNLVVHYKFQAQWDQLDLGVYYNFQPLIFGVWYRGIPLLNSEYQNYGNNESIILLVGLDFKNKFRVAYSYDITISKLSMSSGGSSEISVVYEWPGNSKKARLRRIACPKF